MFSSKRSKKFRYKTDFQDFEKCCNFNEQNFQNYKRHYRYYILFIAENFFSRKQETCDITSYTFDSSCQTFQLHTEGT